MSIGVKMGGIQQSELQAVHKRASFPSPSSRINFSQDLLLLPKLPTPAIHAPAS